MLFVAFVGTAMLVVGGLAMAFQSSSAIGRVVDRIIKRFPGATEFLFGALFGMLVGFVPAAVLYALTKWFWLAVAAEVVAVAACGLLWLKIAHRPKPKRS